MKVRYSAYNQEGDLVATEVVELSELHQGILLELLDNGFTVHIEGVPLEDD